MKRIEERIGEMVKELPSEFQHEVEDFVRFLLEKQTRKPKGNLKFDWEGALEDLGDQYTSVESIVLARLRDLDDELAALAIEYNRLEVQRGLLALEVGLIRPSSSDSA